MIRSYRNTDVRELFEDGKRLKGIPADVQRRAVSKLQMIHAAGKLDDLKVPPGNKLERPNGASQPRANPVDISRSPKTHLSAARSREAGGSFLQQPSSLLVRVGDGFHATLYLADIAD